MLFKIAFLTWLSAIGSDGVTTYQAFSNPNYVNYLHESNPILAPMRNHPRALLGAMYGIDAGTATFVLSQRQAHPKLMTVMLFAMAGERFAVSARNISNMRGVDASFGVHAANGLTLYGQKYSLK